MKKVIVCSILAIGFLIFGTSHISTKAATIDITSLDLETALMMVQSQRANNLDSELKKQIESVQAKNQQLSDLNQQIADLRSQNADGKNNSQIAKLMTEIDLLSNNQQYEMLRLQSISNKRNEVFALMSNIINKMKQSRENIIGNIR